MENLRSICFIYEKKDSFYACYLKEFFKWVGFSYADLLSCAKNRILNEPEKFKFDFFVDINGVFSIEETQILKGKLENQIVSLSSKGETEKTPEQMLNDLLSFINDVCLSQDSCKLLGELARIYEENHLVNVLYDYTFVLLEKLDVDFQDSVYDRLCKAIQDVRRKMDSCKGLCQNKKEDTFQEYALYAIYNCQKHINEILMMQGWAVEFDVGTFLKKIDEIYEYDKDFFKVEFLKAKVSNQDFRYNSKPIQYLNECVERCPVEICKSFHYYNIGKWWESKDRMDRAGEAYCRAYRVNPFDIKSIFKIAIEKKQTEKTTLAIDFLNEIIENWNDEDEKKWFPPREIEYAYKARMNMSELVPQQFRKEWEQRADYFLVFLDNDGKDMPSDCFMKKMYVDDLGKICTAMRQRIVLKCKEQM